MAQYRVKPGKGVSALAMAGGIVFIIIGVLFVIPQFGAFGILWTLFAAGITIFHAINVFSKNGAPAYEASVPADVSAGKESSYEEKIRQLHRLKEEGLVTEEEFQKKKAELLNEKW
ncbi:SHOCT domain-containing protein [Jeotgalibacillus salarius]|uniref:SHOCT domain-containing protein n=1 Tax=Jeotgalibacillus salarius TaxID=546023 RepID=A0A4Y8L1T5_9BACL|nr:SHOCT domain-containing protein [Jeotgalibacillus salarius]TFD96635.1 SHOCT domain-containing protein [Jeotgalibacillus salarius]